MIYNEKFKPLIGKQVKIWTNFPEVFVGKLVETGTDGNYFGFLRFDDGMLIPHDAVIAIKEMSIRTLKPTPEPSTETVKGS